MRIVKKTIILLLAALVLFTLPLVPRGTAAASTSSLTITKYTGGTTINAQVTVDVNTLKSTLPVQGDGVTHYYHQGSVFEGDAWDPRETVNLKDKGAVKGTRVRDLCDTVGGMPPAGEIVIRAVDGYLLTLAYDNIYEPADLQGEVVCAGSRERILKQQKRMTSATRPLTDLRQPC